MPHKCSSDFIMYDLDGSASRGPKDKIAGLQSGCCEGLRRRC
eukprot:CAMPEP_0170630812 /NCGR_PEP_ID=MMETSP0224-20130122/34237_1 /TAXON_ID=285029 /ORGANISM="Togula jolla, Strain CCCM 725" /LENGTH=41 /DNA_ID= /DNA_START= /DNA_END= /DNA_ORIENTATION=